VNRIILLIILVSAGLFAKAQQAHTTKNAKGLKANFSAPVLAAYQENAKTKIEDFYQYLQLLSDVSVSKELKNEVRLNILFLFKNKEVLMKDIASNGKNSLPLSLLISQIENTPSLKFEVGEISSQQIEPDSWQTTYTVKVLNDGKKSELNLSQRVYLTKDSKTFGGNSKEVWQTFLGEIE
jgi:hypothetical protein